MDALTFNPASPVALSALSALRPVQAVPSAPAKAGTTAAATTLSAQDAAQILFQQTLQKAALSSVTDSAATNLTQDIATSLLAALNPAQAAADTTATPTATTNPTAVTTTDATASTAPPAAPPVTTVPDVTTTPDAAAISSTPDFAETTATRFGAGVVAQAALPSLTADTGTNLVRDATQVLRTGNVQAHEGGAGAEAFAQAQTTLRLALSTYEAAVTTPSTQGSSTVDLMA